jgi:hypothetical protein
LLQYNANTHRTYRVLAELLEELMIRRLGIHSFVWTGGQSQDGLEVALRKSAEHGYRTIEFAYLRPEKFNLDRLAKLAQSLDVHNSIKLYINSGVYARTGTDFTTVGIAWQYRWGAGLK